MRTCAHTHTKHVYALTEDRLSAAQALNILEGQAAVRQNREQVRSRIR